jgi:hypothetical protein
MQWTGAEPGTLAQRTTQQRAHGTNDAHPKRRDMKDAMGSVLSAARALRFAVPPSMLLVALLLTLALLLSTAAGGASVATAAGCSPSRLVGSAAQQGSVRRGWCGSWRCCRPGPAC